MRKTIPLLIVLSFVLAQVQAQGLYVPRDVQRAYDDGTRSMDGQPGKNYWENHGHYNISITVAPPSPRVNGHETITYFNNSPDTLKQLNMKLIMNVHRASAPRAGAVPDNYLTEGIQVDQFLQNGNKTRWNNSRASQTNEFVRLDKALMPHDSVKLDITWHYDLAKGPGREGIIDSTSFYIAYFYPRVSVYDDYNGWDRLPFVNAQEFYNDFNDYVLNVTVPKNFMVWATGTLTDADKVLQPAALKRLEASFTSDSTIHIATQQDIAAKAITAQNDMNTWTWTAANITDVAVGVSDHYDWDAASTIVDPATGRRASMQSAFNDTAKDFHQAVKYGCYTLNWLSRNWPGVPYPFPKMTSFQGFADMEYPMMVNDSHTNSLQFAEMVQDHEIAHTFFPFYMGINESRYAFMDEGWATTFERLIGASEVGQRHADSVYKGFRVNRWIHDRSQMEDLPIITPSSELRQGYGNNSYGKPSLSYFALKDMLGDELFKKALHTYMSNWNGKHPIPWDYFNSMSSGSGRNLNWFFNNWFFTNDYIDLAIESVKKVAGGYDLSIKNIGGFAVPFDVYITDAAGKTESFHQTPIVWERNQKHMVVHIKTNKSVKMFKIDGGVFMDADERDNVWPRK